MSRGAMDNLGQSPELQSRKSNSNPDITTPTGFDNDLHKKYQSGHQVDPEDYQHEGIQDTPSLTTGSSRTSSVYSNSDHASQQCHKSQWTRGKVDRGISSSDSGDYWPQGDDFSIRRDQIQSPSRIWQTPVAGAPAFRYDIIIFVFLASSLNSN